MFKISVTSTYCLDSNEYPHYIMLLRNKKNNFLTLPLSPLHSKILKIHEIISENLRY